MAERSPGTSVLRLSRALPAGPERVFAAMTEPRSVVRWWGPAGFTMPAIELDLRVGGRYRFSMQPPAGDLFHLAGEFLEVEPPNRLVYSFRWEEPDPDDRETVVRLSLDAAGEGTDVSLWQGRFATQARHDLHRDGWTDSLERLGRLLENPR
jgi:uncharacterized protein YndB with AHSA1/START domain